MNAFKFRCSSIGKLMTEPKTLKEGPLSVGARTYIRELAAQETQQRFNYLLTHFLCSFASQSKPLVIVFDDIQWSRARTHKRVMARGHQRQRQHEKSRLIA